MAKPGCTIEDTCGTLDQESHCPKLRTKPGQQGNEALQLVLLWAIRKDTRLNNGLVITSQDQLTPRQWAALHGLWQGRLRAEEWRDKTDREKAELARLQQQHQTQNPRQLPILQKR